MTMRRGLGRSALLVAAGSRRRRRRPAPRRNLVVQVSTEPPGLDLTASPASAIAGVVFYNVQERLVKVDRHGKLVPVARRALVHHRQQELHVLPPARACASTTAAR